MGLAAIGLGLGILLASWGISWFWHPGLQEISLRIANPELHLAGNQQITVTQDRPFTVTQEKPFEVTQSEARKSEASTPENKAAELSKADKGSVTATGEVIQHEVTLFSTVKHGSGQVTTGWTYRDGSGGVPFRQFCYYAAPNADQSSTRVELAQDRKRLQILNASLVPDLDAAIAKCQWWRQPKATQIAS
jgi:hypothetical protein